MTSRAPRSAVHAWQRPRPMRPCRAAVALASLIALGACSRDGEAPSRPDPAPPSAAPELPPASAPADPTSPHAGHGPVTPGAPARVLSDLGSYSHPVSCTALAQPFFDQGLRLLYGFNHDEARLAFQEAGRLDPDCAMAFWGVAYSLGSNYNLPGDPARDRQAYAALEQARVAAAKASERDRAYVTALAARYDVEAPSDRSKLDAAYAEAMGRLAKQFPDDLDAQTLYAESLMDLQPWDLWTTAGEPKGRTLEIVALLEGVLAKDPDHPGANHYYIHAVEASRQPERGLASADRLAKLVPGAGHLVHMPSHIYIRTGRYADAHDTNVQAVAVDEAYIQKWKVEGVYPFMYYPHNVHFVYAAAAMEGRGEDAIAAARKLQGLIPADMIPQMAMLEGFEPMPYFALVRFARWDEILAEPAPAESQRYTTAMWHYARGRALAAKGDGARAGEEQSQLEAIRAAAPKDWLPTQVNAGDALLGIAASQLAGVIAAAEGRGDAAIARLEAAVTLEDQLRYMEPPDWTLPTRELLGQVLLQAGKPAEAQVVLEADLAHWPDNGWALRDLARSLRAQGKESEAKDAEARLAKAWARADPALQTAATD